MKHAIVIPLSREHADDLRDCGHVKGTNVTVDRESACYRAWRARHRKRPAEAGPGTLVKNILLRMGYADQGGWLVCANGAKVSNCGCAKMQRKMDAWGWSGCLLHMPELIKWFTTKARACGVTLDVATVRQIIEAAWASRAPKTQPASPERTSR